MTKFTKTAIASLFVFSAAGASAAAFQLAEGSTSGLGMAFAGNAAVADNATVVGTNPALMTKFKQVEVSAGGILVDSDINVEGQIYAKRNGQVIAVPANQKNIVPNAIVPNAYIVAPVNDRFSLGGGVNVNYGLKSEFSPNYSAGFFGGRTSLAAMNVNLSGAYKLNDHFSVGLGLNAVHAKATLERYLGFAGKGAAAVAEGKALEAKAAAEQYGEAAKQAGLMAAQYQQQGKMAEAQTAKAQSDEAKKEADKYGTLANQAAQLARTYSDLEAKETIHKLKGDKWGFGWNAGLLYEINENHRIGFAYHSAVKLNFKGQYSNTMNVEIPSVVDTATGGVKIGGSLQLTLPAFWEVSGFHKFTDKFAMQFSYKRTDWSKFKRLEAKDNTGKTLFHKDENFTNSSRIAVGFSYDVNEKLTLRTGLAFDESASISNPSISIPDTDRAWYSAGLTYRFTPNLSTDFGYSHIRGSKNQFNEEGKGDFKVKAKANLYGLNVNYKF